ncbi:MAG: C25 family cysteine peptidase [Anaerolineae bacterium]|jgi:hypothetical protein
MAREGDRDMNAAGGFSGPDDDLRARMGEAQGQVSKVVKEAQAEMNRLAAVLAEDEAAWDKRVAAESGGGIGSASRPPRSESVNLIVSSKRALVNKYGKYGFERLDSDLHDLKQAVESRAKLEAVILYVDNESSLKRFGLQPVESTNPWQVKRLVDAVDARLDEEGREVGYLLIVGGDEIIPFHRLPNPVDDQDSNVPSDNPYACRDSNYLIPDRAIGRMPDGHNEGVGFLRTLIKTSAQAHRSRAVSKGLISTLGAALHRIRHSRANDHGLGYSASIWRKASRAVFQVIGHDDHLRTSPPLTYEGFQVTDRPHFSYFNLHGIEDGPNWYGQRDALFPADYPLFPLALRPEDPSIEEHENSVVFTEACYGANILGKSKASSIALQMMAARALAVVGSTKVSYGSIAPPLLGADLIGRHFWEGLQNHLTVGDALRHAKVSLATDMYERQGYLDDEDQKALMSFVLYGDPSLPITSIQRERPAGGTRDVFCPPIICSKIARSENGMASDELVASVKNRIETSLPHMSHAMVRARPLGVCDEGCGHNCGSEAEAQCACSSQRQKGSRRNGRGWSLTLKKDIAISGDGAHHQVVKVVVDETGHILKMSMSK